MNLSRPDRSTRLDALAAQYALGTLSPRARRRLDAIARTDAAVAAALQAWEQRLAVLATEVPGVTPPPRVWQGIEARLGLGGRTESPDEAATWWHRLALWRTLAVASTVAAVALAVALVAGRVGPSTPSIVVVISGPGGQPALVATAAGGERSLRVKPLSRIAVSADRALELWAVPQGGEPRSLGLLDAATTVTLPLSADAASLLAATPTLAVSVEPAGGSPTGKPTGPVLYSGRVERFD